MAQHTVIFLKMIPKIFKTIPNNFTIPCASSVLSTLSIPDFPSAPCTPSAASTPYTSTFSTTTDPTTQNISTPTTSISGYELSKQARSTKRTTPTNRLCRVDSFCRRCCFSACTAIVFSAACSTLLCSSVFYIHSYEII